MVQWRLKEMARVGGWKGSAAVGAVGVFAKPLTVVGWRIITAVS